MGSRGIALLFLQSRRQMGMGGERHAPAALPSGKTRYTLNTRLGWLQGRSGRVRKTHLSPGFDPQTVQSVVSRYTPLRYPGLYVSTVGHANIPAGITIRNWVEKFPTTDSAPLRNLGALYIRTNIKKYIYIYIYIYI